MIIPRRVRWTVELLLLLLVSVMAAAACDFFP